MASDLRAQLQKASAQLKADGHAELSASVDAALAPGGWTLLRAAQGTDNDTENLPLNITETLREKLKTAAKAKGTTLGAVASQGLRAVAEGQWTPPVPVRAARGSLKASGVKRVTLNVWVESEPRRRVEQKLPALSKDAGRQITASHIALSWIREKLGVTDD